MSRVLITLACLSLCSLAVAQEVVEDLLFVGDDTGTGDQFAYSVDLNGNRAILGAPYDRPVTFGNASGSAYLFRPATWNQKHKLIASDASDIDNFGWSVSVEGAYAVVGAPRDDDQGQDSGSAYVFDAQTGAELHKLLPTIAAAGNRFGDVVVISGTRVAISSRSFGIDSPVIPVHVFDLNTGQLLSTVEPTGPVLSSSFGISMAFEGDLLLVGSPSDLEELVPGRGEAFLFDVSSGVQLAKFLPTDPYDPQFPGGAFGRSVALDGQTALIGAPYMPNAGVLNGAAYAFDLSTGQLQQRLEPGEGILGHAFGWRVAMGGGRLLVGAVGGGQNPHNAGGVYVFDEETGLQTAKLASSNPSQDDFFSFDLAVDDDVVLIGSLEGDIPDQGLWNIGTAHVFDLDWSGEAFCFGDGSGNACPCGANGNSGQGCANTGGSGGALLRAAGLPSIANDSFLLSVTNLPGNKPGLILRGAAVTNGGLGNLVGDGLLCTSGQTARSQVLTSSQGSVVFKDFKGQGFGASSYGPGVDTHYQFWYRDPQNSCSGAGFNFSNAWRATWEL